MFILGDHGMSLSGNHGGVSKSETQVPLVVIRSQKNVRYREDAYGDTPKPGYYLN